VLGYAYSDHSRGLLAGSGEPIFCRTQIIIHADDIVFLFESGCTA
jgi:hypothetical protein